MSSKIKLHKLPITVLTVLLFICVSAAAGFYAIRNVSVAQAAQITAPKTLEELREADPNEVAKLSYFDGREYGYMTSIRNQTTSTCWAHAITACMELNILRNGIDPDLNVETFDLSENNLAWQTFNRDDKVDPLGNTSAFEFKGEWDKASNLKRGRFALMQWAAPRETSGDDDLRNAKEGEVKYFAKDILHLSDGFGESADMEEIKAAIVKYGAVTFSFNSTLLLQDDVYYNDTKSKKYGTESHACAIVGWDDNIPATSFNSVQTYKNGAWLVRNSWGDYCHDNGYFWFSYDCSLGDEVYAFDMGMKSEADNNYYYDGDYATFGIGVDGNAKAAVIFEAKCGENRRELVKGIGVDVYASNIGTKIQVDFYKNVIADKNDRLNVEVNLPESGEHVATVTRTVYYQGFYNLPLDEGDWFKVEKGSYFSAVVSVDNGSINGCQEFDTLAGACSMTYVYNNKNKVWSHKTYEAYSYTAIPRISCYTVVVEGRDITESEILLEKVAYEYTGKPIEPRVAVIYHGALIPLEDYSITYLNNVNVGEATLIIDGIRDYACSVTCNFYIIKGTVPELSFKDLDVEYKNGELKVSPDTKRLSDITLPADWEWAEPDSEIVDDMEATAVYIGEDKQNYLNLTKTLHITVESVLDNDGDKDNDADNGHGSDTDNNTGTGNNADSGTDNNVDINAPEKGFSWAWLALPAGIIIIGAAVFVIIITRKNRNG